MKVTSSRLIEQKKPVLKQLLDRLLQTYSYASILMTDSKGKQYTISKQGISITENMFVELGYVVKAVSYTHLDVYKRQIQALGYSPLFDAKEKL